MAIPKSEDDSPGAEFGSRRGMIGLLSVVLEVRSGRLSQFAEVHLQVKYYLVIEVSENLFSLLGTDSAFPNHSLDLFPSFVYLRLRSVFFPVAFATEAVQRRSSGCGNL